MGVSSLFSIGAKAMTASYAALNTTSHNISNANVEGYSRQQVELATSNAQSTGSGYIGSGVDVTAVTRTHDAFLTREAATSRSLAAMDASRLQLMKQLEAALPSGKQGVGYAAGEFLNAMVDLTAQPDDDAARAVVLGRAKEVASRFAAAGEQLDGLQDQVTEALKNSVAQINQLAANIAELNQRIVVAQGAGQTPNDLLDQRDQAVSDLSQLVQVSTLQADNGSLTVSIAGGQGLVVGSHARELTVQADASDPTRSALALSDGDSVRVLQSDELGGGSVAGLMSFQNEDLVDARTQLGQLAAALAGAVNQQQALGLDLGDPPGSGEPMFSVGAAVAVPNANNAVDGSGQYIGQVSLSVIDASQLQASEYSLRADPGGPSGVWELTRLSDGKVFSISSGDQVDGMRIDIGPPTPAATDRFLLQPVTHAADDMACVLTGTDGIAAASPLSAEAGSGNSGSSSIGALNVVSTTADPQLTASITFTSGSGDYSWELRDSTTHTLQSSGTGTWSAGTPIALNGFELELSGAPKSGDVFTVSQTRHPASNNGNALAFTALRDEKLVGRVAQSGGGFSGGSTVTDAYATVISRIGVSVQGASSSAAISASVATQAESARGSNSGVNLDEEAARLIQYQQSYQAAAKILQVAQTIFDTLLDAS